MFMKLFKSENHSPKESISQSNSSIKSVSIFVLLLLIVCSASAKTYYFSSVSGDDSRTATQAQNASTPWKTISKLNSYFTSLSPGDFVLFKSGETFYGTINITKSGTSTALITFGAYGTGAKPVITGFTTLSNWVSIGSGRFQSYNSSLGTSVNMLTLNDVPKAFGRYPNSNATYKGYLTFESHGTTWITDKELTSTINWTGAEMVLRTQHWIFDRVKVSNHSGTTVSFSGATTYPLKNGYGYFFQNDIKALDQLGEWSYQSSTKKISMYFGTNIPANYRVKASVLKNVVYIFNKSHIAFDNLAFTGANENSFYLYASHNIRIRNCEILSSGINGIFTQNSNSSVIENCDILNSNSVAINLFSNSHSAVIKNNRIKNIGVLAGMAPSGNHTNVGIRANGDNHLIEYNILDSIGYNGIRFTGNGVLIKNNLVSNFALVKDDAGGIYTGSTDGEEKFNRRVIGNIILNGIGAKEGTNTTTVQQVSGIYLDNNSSGVTITGNTVANCGKLGLYIHNSYNVVIRDNTLFDNTAQTMLNHDDTRMAKVRNITMKNNIFLSKTPTQVVAYYFTKLDDIASFGTIDSNYYARPLDDKLTITGITGLYTGAATQITTKYTLETWKLKYGKDAASKKSPKTFASTTNPYHIFKFEYNASNVSKTIPLSGTYIDVKNKSYSNSVTLAPYSSIVLMKTADGVSINLSPTVNITSPVNNATYTAPGTVQLIATAADADGTISKVDFYNGSKLIVTEKSAPYSWAWKNVPAGTYTITAKATDNSGNVTTSAAVNITVGSSTTTQLSSLPEVNITSPVINASYNAPANVQLTATATDADGTISKVEFFNGSTLIVTEKIAPYSWTWKNVPAGTYTITAKATDNSGNSTISTPVSFLVKATVLGVSAGSNEDLMSISEAVDNPSSEVDFRLFPNPALSKVSIELNSLLSNQKVNLVIRNLAGSTMKDIPLTLTGRLIEVDVSFLTPGMYILSISGTDFIQSKKFIKN